MPRGLWEWLQVFGPGAIVASLTIGTGELVFSSRGGAIFGYRCLFLFAVILLLKWALVFAAARQMVLTGVHPYERMLELPGPRGWLVWVTLLIAATCLPIWVSFHCGVLGNLTAWVTGTQAVWNGGVDYLWGAGMLAVVLVLTWRSGYSRLERIQLVIVAAMILAATVTLVLYRPDWWALLRGAVVPQPLSYPAWLPGRYPHVAAEPVWVEATRYVGVIGGGAFDYLAYVSFVRARGWGQAGRDPAAAEPLAAVAAAPAHPARRWTRAPLVDSALSFLVVFVFSAVFVASGSVVLGPRHVLPDETNLLGLQAAFVTGIHPWLLPLYLVGALLAMLGTLYGTLEVACSLVAELARCVDRDWARRHAQRVRRGTLIWCAVGAGGILWWLGAYQSLGAPGRPRLLLAILTPANVLTGVLGCGLVCLLNLWTDRRCLPRALQQPSWLALLNLVAAGVFLGVGLKGLYDLAR
ncbi:MAG: Nramp family divalent metal transporter [Pirellulaceae bacterium]|nr:Nramp family divalent metal transporter [Pirellulaceae bacterium]